MPGPVPSECWRGAAACRWCAKAEKERTFILRDGALHSPSSGRSENPSRFDDKGRVVLTRDEERKKHSDFIQRAQRRVMYLHPTQGTMLGPYVVDDAFAKAYDEGYARGRQEKFMAYRGKGPPPDWRDQGWRYPVGSKEDAAFRRGNMAGLEEPWIPGELDVFFMKSVPPAPGRQGNPRGQPSYGIGKTSQLARLGGRHSQVCTICSQPATWIETWWQSGIDPYTKKPFWIDDRYYCEAHAPRSSNPDEKFYVVPWRESNRYVLSDVIATYAREKPAAAFAWKKTQEPGAPPRGFVVRTRHYIQDLPVPELERSSNPGLLLLGNPPEYRYERDDRGFLVEYEKADAFGPGKKGIWRRLIPENEASLPKCGKHYRLHCPDCYIGPRHNPPMSRAKAQAEARRRWGADAWADPIVRGAHPGGMVAIGDGHGLSITAGSWEEAFAQADGRASRPNPGFGEAPYNPEDVTAHHAVRTRGGQYLHGVSGCYKAFYGANYLRFPVQVDAYLRAIPLGKKCAWCGQRMAPREAPPLVRPNPDAPADVRMAWEKFHFTDFDKARSVEIDSIPGVPEQLWALGQWQDCVLEDGTRWSRRGKPGSPSPWLCHDTTDNSLWIVSIDPLPAVRNGAKVKTIAYCTHSASDKDHAVYEHKFHKPLPTIEIVKAKGYPLAALLQGGKYTVTDWIRK